MTAVLAARLSRTLELLDLTSTRIHCLELCANDHRRGPREILEPLLQFATTFDQVPN